MKESLVVVEMFCRTGQEKLVFQKLQQEKCCKSLKALKNLKALSLKGIWLKKEKIVFIIRLPLSGWNDGIYYQLASFLENTLKETWKDLRFFDGELYFSSNSEPLLEQISEAEIENQLETLLEVA